MMELLLHQRLNDFISALLPDEVSVAHKTGDLPGVRNDQLPTRFRIGGDSFM